MATNVHIEVLGAGGHAKVVIEALVALGHSASRIGIRDDRQELAGTQILGCDVKVPTLPLDPRVRLVHAAVGCSALRRRWLSDSGLRPDQWFTIVHPKSCVSPTSRIGEGAFIAAMALVGPDARIGRSTILNHGSSVDHDCWVGSFVHLAPSSTLCGGVSIGDDVLVGAGAVVLPGVRVGHRAVIGAGAVVATDVADGTTVVGVPAKTILDPK